MFELQAKSNIENKVRNTKLPRTKPLIPLFEMISNSIHSIEEAEKRNLLKKGDGKIKIKVIRNGEDETLKGLADIDIYPVNSFEIIDNGIGLNDENLNYFSESDTDHKIDIGGKGVGRFVALKAFKALNISSSFYQNDKKYLRKFDFTATKKGFENPVEEEVSTDIPPYTKIVLYSIRPEYLKHLSFNLHEIAKEIVVHFQLYFIRNQAPSIVIENQNNISYDLQTLFRSEVKSDIQNKPFSVLDYDFNLFLTKSYTAQSHKIHYCAHNRSVKEEGLSNKIIDLGKFSIKPDEGDNFYYQAYVVGDILDESVDLERVGFTFPNEEDEEEENDINQEISLPKIRRSAIVTIEEILEEYLNDIREAKIENYKPIIYDELPQYRSILALKTEAIKKLPPNLPKEKLDIELYKIEAQWKIEVKEEEHLLLDENKDITNIDEYKIRYEKFLTEFNETGKVDLARYVVHRKAVIELLDKLIGKEKDDNKFTDEDIIHSVFFPIRSTSDEVPHNKQNLWLIDERLTYHSFLASDKYFNKIKNIESNSNNRPDLIIFNDALAFTEESNSPYNSFTIVEFKKPQRDGYKDLDPTKNPLSQAEQYINDLLEGTVIDRRGRRLKVDKNTPFYVYIICDITKTFEEILDNREFDKTPDGQGYYLLKRKKYSAYIEVLPFEKVLNDARKRNRILFEKLGLSS